jgi:hypothetical protein
MEAARQRGALCFPQSAYAAATERNIAVKSETEQAD